MSNKIKICFLDEEPTWQYMAHKKLGDDFDVDILEQEKLPKEVSSIWSIIIEKEPDVIIVDYKLNESGVLPYTGDAVVSEIRKHNLHLPIFMMTSFEQNALQECVEVQIVRGKEMLSESSKLENLKTLIRASVNQYNSRKLEYEGTILRLAAKIDAGEELTEDEMADKFDAELYISELDLDSGVRSHLINHAVSSNLSDLVEMAGAILDKISK